MLVLTFSITLYPFLLSIIPLAQAYHWAGNVMYDLEYQGYAFDSEASSWTSSLSLVTSGVVTSLCGTNRVLGGYNVMAGSSGSGSWTRTYSSLATHNTIYFKMKFYMVDSWSTGGDHFHLSFDSSDNEMWTVGSNYANYATTNQWGNPSYNDLDPMMIYFTIPHSASTLTVLVRGDYSSDLSTVKSFAIRDVSMTLATETTVPSNSYCGITGGYPLSGGACGCDSGTTMSPANSGLCSGCDSSCLTCSGTGPSKCTSCPSGKLLLNGACSLCPNVVCLTCTPVSSGINLCTSCTAGRYPASGACYVCDSSCLKCDGAGRTACTSCSSSRILVSGTCCDSTCASCSGTGTSECLSCPDGRYLSTSGTCPTCHISCKTCSGSALRTACTSCQSPLVLIGGTCCDPSCDTCSGTGANNCASCTPGEYLTSGGACSSCDSSCLTCGGSSRQMCLTCAPPLVIVAGTCCDPSCATCSGTTSSSCSSCIAGKYLTSGGVCSGCDSTCVTCNAAGRTGCVSCSSSLVLSGTTCCHPDCATCTWTANTNCASCVAGKYLTSGGACSSCDPSCSTCNGGARTNCLSCSSSLVKVGTTCCDPSCATCSGTGVNDCVSCIAGKYLTSGGACSSCDSSCLTCNGAARTACASCTSSLVLSSGACCHSSCVTCSGTTASNCLSCVDGKYLTSSNSCSSCDSSCLTCTGGTQTTCASCQSPYVLSSGSCCHSSCATCSGTGSSNCLSCANGKYLTSSNSCSSCDSSCLTCTGGTRTTCASCQSPLIKIGSTCCDPSCATCSGTGVNSCTSCVDGKYLMANGACSSCDPSCLTCNGATRALCTSCLSPLVFVSGTCCDSSCATCSGTTSTSCNSCVAGKYLTSGGACSSCDPSCSTCNGGARTNCLSCSSSLVKVSTTCCDPSCATCSGTGVNDCVSCIAGKYLTSGGACFSCDSSCLTCNGVGRTQCISCQSSLVLVGLSCCHPSCATCVGTGSNHCASCVNGKYLTSGGACSSCDSSCLTCNGAGPTGCLTCAANNYLSGTSCFNSCDPPLVKSSSGGIDYCDTPCSGQYAYIEGGCGSCPLPRKRVKKNDYDVCGTPCTDISTFYYWNGTCLSTCQHPLDTTIDANTGAKFCTNPCGTSTDYLFSNHTCLSTCPSPLSAIADPGVQYCRTPCNLVSFLYENRTCIGNCLLPFVKRFEPFAQFCDKPCDPGIFWFRNTSCLASCPAPYVQNTYSGVLQCLPPCKDSEFFYEFEKICNPKCESPFSMKTFDVIKICYNEIPISLAETTNVQNAAAGIQSQGDMASGGMKAAGAMNSGSPSSALLAGLSSMLQYIRYMKINYPPKVQMLFVVSAGSPISLGFDFDIPESVANKLDDNTLADVFEKYDINSNFVENLWDFLMTLMIVMMVIGALSLIKFVVPEKRFPRSYLILTKILGAMRWNVPIMMVCSSSGDIFFYASLQIQSSSLNSFAAVICLIVSLLMMIVVLVILMIGLKILKNWKKEAKNPNWSDKWKGYEILYEEYEEKSIWSLSYMILFLVRGIIFNLTLANLYRFPLIQCIIINISNVLMFSYLIYLRPLKDFLNLVQLFVNEGLVNIIGVSIIILAIMDKAGIKGQSTRVSVGEAIYFVIKVFNTFGLVFMGLGMLIFLVLLFKTWRRLKAQKINSPLKIFKAMVLGEAVGETKPNPFEMNEVSKKVRIRKPPRKHSVRPTNQMEVIYIDETEMSRVQMVNDISRADLTINEDFSPKRNNVRRQTEDYQEEVSETIQISDLDNSNIQPSYELTREVKEENSPSFRANFRGFTIEKSEIMNFTNEIEEGKVIEERISPDDQSIEIIRERRESRSRKILKNPRKSREPTAQKLETIEINDKEEKVLDETIEKGMTEVDVTKIEEDPKMKNKGLGGFLKILGGKIKGQKKSKEPKISAEKQEKLMEEKVKTGASEIKVTELQNDADDVKNNSGGFIQNWGKFKGRMKSRRATVNSLGQEQGTGLNKREEVMGEKIETVASGIETSERMSKNMSVGIIQDWGRLKDRMKASNLHQEEKSETIGTNKKEDMKEGIETKTAGLELTEFIKKLLEEKKRNVEDMRGGKGRIARRQQKNLIVQKGEKSKINNKSKKEEIVEEKIETGMTDLEITEISEIPQIDGLI